MPFFGTLPPTVGIVLPGVRATFLDSLAQDTHKNSSQIVWNIYYVVDKCLTRTQVRALHSRLPPVELKQVCPFFFLFFMGRRQRVKSPGNV